MMEQPLMTEEGFLNPACMQELEGAIANTGKTGCPTGPNLPVGPRDICYSL